MQKIRITDDLIQIIATLSEGNPGAMSALTELARSSQKRPLIFAWGVKMFLDLGLSGSEIYMLWNDCLGRRLTDLIILIDEYARDRIPADDILQHVRAAGGRGTPITLSREGTTWLY